MKFKENNKPIYLQIAETICDGIMNGSLPEGARIPSVREYAASVSVNPNTVMRTYDHLSREGVIANRRGIGFFVTDDARELIRKSRQATFLGEEMDDNYRRLSLLGVTPEELAENYRRYLSRQ